MILRFARTAKELKAAANSGSISSLKRLYPHDAELVLQALYVLANARNLSEVLNFKTFRPHPLTGDKQDQFSMSVGGRKRLIVKTLDSNGKPTKSINLNSEHGLIVEVNEHYGD